MWDSYSLVTPRTERKVLSVSSGKKEADREIRWQNEEVQEVVLTTYPWR